MTRILVIAGSDSSGGAGIARDLATLDSLGSSAGVAITAITAQDSRGVHASLESSPALVRAQVRAAMSSPVDGIKVGMLASASIASEVAELLSAVRAARPGLPIVIDPVMVSSSGSPLLTSAAIGQLAKRLLPLASLVTPNRYEFDVLYGEFFGVTTRSVGAQKDDVVDKASRLARHLQCAVLRKGGHDSGPTAIDLLCTGAHTMILESPRVAAKMRGTGCALASAICHYMARGDALPRACRRGKEHVTRNLRATHRQAR